jgi:glycosyltransferase involved in cell wall biosynthesis
MIGRRVLWITERYPPAKGGMAVSAARQVRGLRRRGVLVDVVAFLSGQTEAAITIRDGGADILIPREREHGLGPNQAWSMIGERQASCAYACAVGFGAAWAGYLAVTFGAWLHVPCAVLVRGNDLDRDWFLARRGGWLREALSRAAAIGAVSSEKVARIQALYPNHRVVWTPNGVDVERWQLLPADRARRDEIRGLLDASGRRIIGLFGDLKAKKGVPFWLEALRDQNLLGRTSLLIAGNVDDVTGRILDDPALAPKSLRIPFSPQDEMAGLYAACDFVAIPSTFDGMPNVLLEAMACGTPPIVSDAGALGDVVADGVTGFVFRAGDREAAGRATARAVNMDQAAREQMSQRARQTAGERFTAERETDILLELLNQASE